MRGSAKPLYEQTGPPEPLLSRAIGSATPGPQHGPTEIYWVGWRKANLAPPKQRRLYTECVAGQEVNTLYLMTMIKFRYLTDKARCTNWLNQWTLII